MKKGFVGLLCAQLMFMGVQAQKLAIDNVRKAVVSHSGTIMENNEVSGYFTFYMSDKIDKNTNEYTVRIADKDLNPIKDIKFEDDKDVAILESSYNGNSIMFLFYNKKEKTLEYRAYDFNGKQKMSYTKELNKRSKMLLEETYGQTSDEGQNEALFDIENRGYVTVYPVKEGKYYSYEVNFFFTEKRKQWTYEAAEEQDDKFAKAIYLGNTNDICLFEVVKQKSLLGGKPHSWVLGLNIETGKKVFEISTEKESDYKFYPMNISTLQGGNNILMMGTYYGLDDNILKDRSQGLGMWVLAPDGKVISKKYNSWENDFSKFLNIGNKGKINNIGFLYFHKIVQTDDGKFFAVGEGYRKEVSAAGVLSNALSMASGSSRSNISNFKVKVTDMVLLQFDDKFNVQGATIYDKFNNNIAMPGGTGFMSPHVMALMVKAWGGFDYDYMQINKDRSNFVIGYSDYEKSGEYKGVTFNSISYYDHKVSTDKIKLDSKSSWMKIYPAKTGHVVIMEYFKKAKKIEYRMEKLN
jgi:hypothetical protein